LKGLSNDQKLEPTLERRRRPKRDSKEVSEMKIAKDSRNKGKRIWNSFEGVSANNSNLRNILSFVS